MHGLRCDPALRGWTRLLDEWVVGLLVDGRSRPRLSWNDPAATRGTLHDAIARVRSFAYSEGRTETTEPLADGTLRFELQGCCYRVAVRQRFPASASELASAGQYLIELENRVERSAQEDEQAVAALFLTPRLAPDASPMEDFVLASRSIECRGCAFSFPTPRDAGRYRHGNPRYPGVILAVGAAAPSPAFYA